MKNDTTPEKSVVKKWLLPVAMVLVIAICAYWLYQSGFIDDIQDRERLVSTLRDSGWGGPLLCVVVQFVQVVIFFIPGEITQFAAGYVFGTWWGLVYSIVGIMLGSAFNFYFARLIGRPTLERFISHSTMERVDSLLNHAKSKMAIFLLFLLPGAPKDAMSYGAGFSRLTMLEFTVISGLGRAPALLFSVYLGAETSQGDYQRAIWMAVLAGLAVGGYLLYQRFSRKDPVSLPEGQNSASRPSETEKHV
jgi:uncharacterized membrane protein YdjX (TVP38/TMEM64 family)